MNMNKNLLPAGKKTPQTFFIGYIPAVQIFHLHSFYLQHSKAGVKPICIQLEYL